MPFSCATVRTLSAVTFAVCSALTACGDSGLPTAKAGAPNLPVPNTPIPPVVVTAPGKCAAKVAIPQETHYIPNSGRKVLPLGRLTKVGNFPTGGALTPDGKFYWSAAAGLGTNDLSIVSVASGGVVQKLPMPGSYGQVIFSSDGKTAYASGIAKGSSPTSGPTMGDSGDVIHVFTVDTSNGTAIEKPTIALPSGSGNSAARKNTLPANPNLPSFPVGMALSPDDKTLVVALYNADKAAVITTATGVGVTVAVGQYPYHVAIERSGRYAYVSNAYDGTLSRIDLTNTGATASPTTVSGIGGPAGDNNAQPQYVLADPNSDTLYVAVTNQDGIAVVNTLTNTVSKFISVKRPEGYGTQPVALALAPDGSTLYVALAGDNAIAAYALTTRGSTKQYDLIGKLPTADYTSDIDISPDGCTLVWTAARGFDPLPNPNYGTVYAPAVAPVDSYVPALLRGYVGVLPTLSDAGFASLTAMVDGSVKPTNFTGPPTGGSPIHGAATATASGFLPSAQIKYVFYIVKENRTYDQIFGSDPRGNGQANLEVFGDNGTVGPSGGITPNVHALSRMFQLFDNFLEDSEVSTDGHVITAGAYASNYSTKSLHQDYAGRGRPYDIGIYPVSFPPKYFLFDQAATQGISFHIYGERSGGAAPMGADSRSTYPQVAANSDSAYPSNVLLGCIGSTAAPGFPDTPNCAFDCGLGCNQPSPPAPAKSQSRIDVFNSTFASQVTSCTAQTLGTAACGVPFFNYLIMVSDHTNGNGAGQRLPQAMVADNDLGIGQFVDIVSHSAIWPQTAIFIVEDDAQDGPDHVDAHRSEVTIASPYAIHGGSLNHTRYDQYSLIRTLELMLGLQPLSLYDASATPMYDAFTTTPNLAPYTAIKPTQNLFALSTGALKSAALSAALPWNVTDAVPQAISDRILWESVYGDLTPAPAPGPNASASEAERAVKVQQVFNKYQANPVLAKAKLRRLLTAQGEND